MGEQPANPEKSKEEFIRDMKAEVYDLSIERSNIEKRLQFLNRKIEELGKK